LNDGVVAALAAFGTDGTRGNLLEFALSFADAALDGFTVRAHGHDVSSLRSDAVALDGGRSLDIASVLEEVTRLAVAPPPAFADAAASCLGVYRSPARTEAERIGELAPGQEILAAHGGRAGRWLRISWPLSGWVQVEARDGRPLVCTPTGSRPASASSRPSDVPRGGDRGAEPGSAAAGVPLKPHHRLVVTVRPAAPESSMQFPVARAMPELPVQTAPHAAAPGVTGIGGRADNAAPHQDASRAHEFECAARRAREVLRMDREAVRFERSAFAARHRQQLLGVL